MTVVTSDGRTLEWSGLGICYCTKCEQIFNSLAAFDFHIRTDKATGERRHDFAKMPRNAKGYLVTKLPNEDAGNFYMAPEVAP